MGLSWGVNETTVGRIIRKVEDILVKCGKFRLPSVSTVIPAGARMANYGGRCGRSRDRTSEKNKKRYYSAAKAGRIILPACCLGKQKCHTLKAQVLINLGTGQNFKLLKRSRLPFRRTQLCLADRGSSRICQTL